VNLLFPSQQFNDMVAAVCHGLATEEQMQALNELLRVDPAARDEYLLRVELHSRLASDPDLFATTSAEAGDTVAPDRGGSQVSNIIPLPTWAFSRRQGVAWAVGLAACLLILVGVGLIWFERPNSRKPTSLAVAVMSQAVEARWNRPGDARPVGAALEPGWLRLRSGLVQVTFYSGARLVLEGPAEVQLVSPGEAFCQAGRVMVEVPAQARGFRVGSPQVKVVDLGTQFGLDVKRAGAEVQVFKGEVEYLVPGATKHSLKEGEGVLVETGGATRRVSADSAVFDSLFDLQRRWLAMLALRYENWRTASAWRNQDSSLLARFDLEDTDTSGWTLHNVGVGGNHVTDATIIGCSETEGRWPGKHALEFRSPSDRVRFSVPGEFRALTLSAWVNVKGLDRQFNSLFMCDGFDAGKIHWQIRSDGVLDLGVQGPHIRDVQIFASPAVVGFHQFGQWLHLAAVVDGERRQVIHYVNGMAVSRHALKLPPPYRIGAAELGNWNAGEMPNQPPFLIRHFSGAMDEFALFNRALSDAEIQALYSEGKPQPDL